MIRFSAALVVAGLGLLLAGAITSELPLVYAAIAVSVGAALTLTVGVIAGRDEIFGKTPAPELPARPAPRDDARARGMVPGEVGETPAASAFEARRPGIGPEAPAAEALGAGVPDVEPVTSGSTGLGWPSGSSPADEVWARVDAELSASTSAATSPKLTKTSPPEEVWDRIEAELTRPAAWSPEPGDWLPGTTAPDLAEDELEPEPDDGPSFSPEESPFTAEKPPLSPEPGWAWAPSEAQEPASYEEPASYDELADTTFDAPEAPVDADLVTDSTTHIAEPPPWRRTLTAGGDPVDEAEPATWALIRREPASWRAPQEPEDSKAAPDQEPAASYLDEPADQAETPADSPLRPRWPWDKAQADEAEDTPAGRIESNPAAQAVTPDPPATTEAAPQHARISDTSAAVADTPELVTDETVANETAADETAATTVGTGEPDAPETTAPEAAASEIAAPETTAPEIAASEAITPGQDQPTADGTAPDGTAPDDTALDGTAPDDTPLGGHASSEAHEPSAPSPELPRRSWGTSSAAVTSERTAEPAEPASEPAASETAAPGTTAAEVEAADPAAPDETEPSTAEPSAAEAGATGADEPRVGEPGVGTFMTDMPATPAPQADAAEPDATPDDRGRDEDTGSEATTPGQDQPTADGTTLDDITPGGTALDDTAPDDTPLGGHASSEAHETSAPSPELPRRSWGTSNAAVTPERTADPAEPASEPAEPASTPVDEAPEHADYPRCDTYSPPESYSRPGSYPGRVVFPWSDEYQGPDPARPDTHPQADHPALAGTMFSAPVVADTSASPQASPELDHQGASTRDDPPPAPRILQSGRLGHVLVVPGVARYHRRGCILIRFLSEDDIESLPRAQAEAEGCVPCKACQIPEPRPRAD